MVAIDSLFKENLENNLGMPSSLEKTSPTKFFETVQVQVKQTLGIIAFPAVEITKWSMVELRTKAC